MGYGGSATRSELVVDEVERPAGVDPGPPIRNGEDRSAGSERREVVTVGAI